MTAAPSFAVDFQSSRTLSLAETGRGGALLSDTVIVNPSLLGFQPTAAFAGTFNWLNGSQTNDVKYRTFNVSAIDGRNQYVEAGFAFTRKSEFDTFHLALAKRVLPWLSVGASGKRFAFNSESEAYPGADRMGMDGGVSASFGVPLSIVSVPLQFGVTADNMMHGRSTEAVFGPRQLGFGAKATLTNILMLYGDFVENYPREGVAAFPMFYGAAELALGGDFYARGGGFRGREKGWSAGAGWIGPRMGLNYGYQNRLVSTSARGFQHSMTVELFL